MQITFKLHTASKLFQLFLLACLLSLKTSLFTIESIAAYFPTKFGVIDQQNLQKTAQWRIDPTKITLSLKKDSYILTGANAPSQAVVINVMYMPDSKMTLFDKRSGGSDSIQICNRDKVVTVGPKNPLIFPIVAALGSTVPRGKNNPEIIEFVNQYVTLTTFHTVPVDFGLIPMTDFIELGSLQDLTNKITNTEVFQRALPQPTDLTNLVSNNDNTTDEVKANILGKINSKKDDLIRNINRSNVKTSDNIQVDLSGIADMLFQGVMDHITNANYLWESKDAYLAKGTHIQNTLIELLRDPTNMFFKAVEYIFNLSEINLKNILASEMAPELLLNKFIIFKMLFDDNLSSYPSILQLVKNIEKVASEAKGRIEGASQRSLFDTYVEDFKMSSIKIVLENIAMMTKRHTTDIKIMFKEIWLASVINEDQPIFITNVINGDGDCVIRGMVDILLMLGKVPASLATSKSASKIDFTEIHKLKTMLVI